MGKAKKKTGDTLKAPESTGKEYTCITPHDEPFKREDGSPGFRSFKAGEVEIFDKNPGPYWRPEEEIKKTEEVTDDGAG